MASGVKWELCILLRLWKNESSDGPGYLPFLCFARTESYEHASVKCVCEYTHYNASVLHSFVIWRTVLLLLLWRITRNTITQTCVILPFGERSRVRRVLWRLRCFNNETRSGGHLGQGWEGIGGNGTLALTPKKIFLSLYTAFTLSCASLSVSVLLRTWRTSLSYSTTPRRLCSTLPDPSTVQRRRRWEEVVDPACTYGPYAPGSGHLGFQHYLGAGTNRFRINPVV